MPTESRQAKTYRWSWSRAQHHLNLSRRRRGLRKSQRPCHTRNPRNRRRHRRRQSRPSCCRLRVPCSTCVQRQYCIRRRGISANRFSMHAQHVALSISTISHPIHVVVVVMQSPPGLRRWAMQRVSVSECLDYKLAEASYPLRSDRGPSSAHSEHTPALSLALRYTEHKSHHTPSPWRDAS